MTEKKKSSKPKSVTAKTPTAKNKTTAGKKPASKAKTNNQKVVKFDSEAFEQLVKKTVEPSVVKVQPEIWKAPTPSKKQSKLKRFFKNIFGR